MGKKHFRVKKYTVSKESVEKNPLLDYPHRYFSVTAVHCRWDPKQTLYKDLTCFLRPLKVARFEHRISYSWHGQNKAHHPLPFTCTLYIVPYPPPLPSLKEIYVRTSFHTLQTGLKKADTCFKALHFFAPEGEVWEEDEVPGERRKARKKIQAMTLTFQWILIQMAKLLQELLSPVAPWTLKKITGTGKKV